MRFRDFNTWEQQQLAEAFGDTLDAVLAPLKEVEGEADDIARDIDNLIENETGKIEHAFPAEGIPKKLERAVATMDNSLETLRKDGEELRSRVEALGMKASGVADGNIYLAADALTELFYALDRLGYEIVRR